MNFTTVRMILTSRPAMRLSTAAAHVARYDNTYITGAKMMKRIWPRMESGTRRTFQGRLTREWRREPKRENHQDQWMLARPVKTAPRATPMGSMIAERAAGSDILGERR